MRFPQVYYDERDWESTNKLIEVTKETYDIIVEDEKRIIKQTGKSGWHYPVAYETVPPEKIIIREL